MTAGGISTFSGVARRKPAQDLSVLRGWPIVVTGGAAPYRAPVSPSSVAVLPEAEGAIWITGESTSSQASDFSTRSPSETGILARLSSNQARMQTSLKQLGQEFSKLRDRLATTALFEVDSPPTSSVESIEYRIELLGPTPDQEELAGIVDEAVDAGLKSESIQHQARSLMGAESPFARAAGARAYALCNPEDAPEVLKGLLEAETNATARSVLEGVLRSLD